MSGLLRDLYRKARFRPFRRAIENWPPPNSIAFSEQSPSLFHGADFWHLLSLIQFYDASDVPASLLVNLTSRTSAGLVEMDITRLDGLAAVNNHDWGSLHEFAFRALHSDYDGPRPIRFSSDDDFHRNTKHWQENVRQNPTVVWCEWSGRFFLMNSGTGHHTAAIFRQCVEQGRRFLFTAALEIESLDGSVRRSLEDYQVFICEGHSALKLWSWAHDFESHRHVWIFELSTATRWFDGKSHSVVMLPRESIALQTVRQWLARNPHGALDLSGRLTVYHSQEIKGVKWLPT